MNEADTSVIKKKHEISLMTQEQKKKTGKYQDMEKKTKEKHWTPKCCMPRD